MENQLWWEGPLWLRGPPEEYPVIDSNIDSEEVLEDCQKEVRVKSREVVTSLLVPDAKAAVKLSSLIDVNRFSKWRRLVQVVALVLKFVRLLRNRGQEKDVHIVADDIKEAEKLLILEMQVDIMKHKPVYQKLDSQLGLYADEEGVLRCRGRLGNANLPEDTKYPILLPRDHYLTRLIVEDCHRKVKHGGTKDTLTELRAEYWIPKGRQLVRKIIFNCTTCRRAQGKPYRLPKPAALPEGRLTGAVAFTDVGVDYAGPLYVKTSEGMAKAYICLFTCSTSRAVHLEVAPDLTTQAFLRCLKRFIARRGLPVTIRSDNAQTFRRANKELVAIFESDEVQRFVGQKGIIWRFMLEKAPFFGGFYERMVQVVKRCLRKILGSAKLDYEELVTVITEVEGTINSRPLTYIYSDDIEEPITPAHLILGRRILTLPLNPVELEDEDYNDTSTALQRRARYLNRLLESFWKRWRNEYLLSLREFHHCKQQNQRQAAVKKGDVVLVKDENVIRGKWKTAVVEELIESNDGEIRGAIVRLVNTKGTLTRLKRPLQLLYPIEVNSDEEDRGNTLNISIDEPPLNTEDHERPPRRVAAMNAYLKRRIIDHPTDDQWGEC